VLSRERFLLVFRGLVNIVLCNILFVLEARRNNVLCLLWLCSRHIVVCLSYFLETEEV